MQISNTAKIQGLVFLALYVACVPLANWMVGHVGTFCVPDGPCMVPVWLGLAAPSGVIAIGFALVLRDLVQRRLGLSWSLGAIALGAVISWAISPAALVLASVAAFAFSELADALVFTPLQKRGLVLAVLVSSLAGIVVDSVLFLSLAFHSLDFLGGQIVGKLWAVLVALPLIHLLRQWDQRRGLQPA
ncbi:MAG: VUT family protein [Alphaproteobacteria bacterium]|nr:VUT family protein [Alphaproteobacteria bacterium]